MADWENIPRLDPALQDEIDNVQLKHNALVKAVRGYPGGSIAGKTNEVMTGHNAKLREVATQEKSLISAAGQLEPSPTMLLDFASQTYFTGIRGLEQAVDPHKYLNVSRATPKWVMGPQGKLVEVPPDTLAYEYDPVTGEPKGVLIEESRTNLLQWSEDFTQEFWGKLNGFVAPGTVTAPDGESLAYKFVGEAGETIKRIGRFTSLESETAYTQSWYVKSAGVRYCSTYFRGSEFGSYNNNNTLVIDLETGEFNAGTGITPGVVRLPDGWFRISITGTTINNPSASYSVVSLADSLSLTNAPSITGDGISGIYIWGAQLEEGSSPSSYIPTEDAPATRAGDTVYRTLGDEFNPREGTVYYEGDLNEHASNGSSIAFLHSDSLDNRLAIRYKADDRRLQCIIVKGGVNETIGGVDTLTLGHSKIAAVYDESGRWQVAVDGVVYSGTPVTGTLDAVSDLRIGTSGTGGAAPSYSQTLGVTYYPHALSETELQELTANG